MSDPSSSSSGTVLRGVLVVGGFLLLLAGMSISGGPGTILILIGTAMGLYGLWWPRGRTS